MDQMELITSLKQFFKKISPIVYLSDMINGDHNNGFFQFSGSMGSVSSLSMKLPMLIWLKDRCYATAMRWKYLNILMNQLKKTPRKINNDNHSRLSPAWWRVRYTVICERVVNSIFFFFCVLLNIKMRELTVR